MNKGAMEKSEGWWKEVGVLLAERDRARDIDVGMQLRWTWEHVVAE